MISLSRNQAGKKTKKKILNNKSPLSIKRCLFGIKNELLSGRRIVEYELLIEMFKMFKDLQTDSNMNLVM